MRRIALTICAMIIVATGLAGCYSTNSHTESADGTVDSGGPAVNVHWVPLPDGRRVLCVFEKNSYAGGLSCDWSKAK
jgi:hypothetical protein